MIDNIVNYNQVSFEKETKKKEIFSMKDDDDKDDSNFSYNVWDNNSFSKLEKQIFSVNNKNKNIFKNIYNKSNFKNDKLNEVNNKNTYEDLVQKKFKGLDINNDNLENMFN